MFSKNCCLKAWWGGESDFFNGQCSENIADFSIGRVFI